VFSGNRVSRLEVLMGRRDQLVFALERLPLTFIHGDMNPGNLIAPGGAVDRTALIDWHFSGGQPVGADFANMVGCLAIHGGRLVGSLPEVAERGLEAFLAGARAAGCGDVRDVRFGCLAHLALYNTIGVTNLAYRSTRGGHPLQVRDRDRRHALLDRLTDTLDFLLDFTAEAWSPPQR
jgi:hypothetical protein